ncbi:MAG: RdgB/HAM1 family non-canonical purine NTP pyrophosphatase [Tabrizicola sp.]|nr:RdgB/HAM1 family non-canonical purine NTP pyrophosphatase [Tabrizicola sp.]
MEIAIGRRLLVATHNQGKLDEIDRLLAPLGIEVVGAAALGLPVPEETKDSFAGNARLKARAGVSQSGLPALADDSGLCVDALQGLPGVHTADWAEGPDGRDFDRAMRRVWEALEKIGAATPRRARFHCTLLLACPDGQEHVFEGEVAGQLVWPPRGTQGHGFDPMFQPDGFDVTFGEMDRWAKNRISHRGVAMEKLLRARFT